MDDEEKDKLPKSAAEVIERMHTVLQEKMPANTMWQEFVIEVNKEIEQYKIKKQIESGLEGYANKAFKNLNMKRQGTKRVITSLINTGISTRHLDDDLT